MRFDKSLRKKLMKSPIFILVLLAVTLTGGYAAYITLWQPIVSPTVTISTKGFEAKLVDPTLEATWGADGTFGGLTPTIVLSQAGTNTYDVMLAIGTMRAVTDGQLTIDMTDGEGEWWFQITKCELVKRIFLPSSFETVTDYLEALDPDPIGSSFAFDTTALFDNGAPDEKYVIHIEFEIQQTGMVLTDTETLTSNITLSADMYEPA